jgi:hypothetical protein
MINIIKKIENQLEIPIHHDKYLLIGNAFNKKSLFLYEKGTNLPDIVVRIPNNARAEKMCANEYNQLLYLNNIKMNTILCPSPMGIITHKGLNIFIQKTIYSSQMQNNLKTITKTPRASDFETVVKFLTIIYKKTKYAEIVNNKTFSHCFQHGDFWIGNLGIYDNSLVLYDLEYAVRNGYPLYDLLHFGLYYYVALNNVGKLGKNIRKGAYTKQDDERIFQSAENQFITRLIEGGNFTKIIKNAINEYITQCGINKKDAMYLIKTYFENDRKIIGLNNNWEKEVYKQIL